MAVYRVPFYQMGDSDFSAVVVCPQNCLQKEKNLGNPYFFFFFKCNEIGMNIEVNNS